MKIEIEVPESWVNRFLEIHQDGTKSDNLVVRNAIIAIVDDWLIEHRHKYPIRVPAEYVQLAGEWHGGQWTALYSVSSTGTIYDEEIHRRLEAELRQLQHKTDDTDTPSTGELHARINDFLHWAERFEE